MKTLEDCGPELKAMLGIWRVLRDVVREQDALHPLTERYKAAAYQRQAARRLVDTMERLGGAMLCDGVGLGKTYVATCALLHYLAIAQGRGSRLRATIIVPASVMRQWRHEAIAPLAAYGVSVEDVRILSHSSLSRITGASASLEPGADGVSDLEHLVCSSLVILDESHNFRSRSASRTRALRDLLNIPPGRAPDMPDAPAAHRRVLLLTATPINNSLDDLVQELSLMFSRWRIPPGLDALRGAAYSDQLRALLRQRVDAARAADPLGRRSVVGMLTHGDLEARPDSGISWRSQATLPIPGVGDIAVYLQAQQRLLEERKAALREDIAHDAAASRPIAGALLDAVVVQRSRALCRQIERLESGSDAGLLFRAPPGQPQPLRYEDRYNGVDDVLARYLSLFDPDAPRLGLRVYMWHEVAAGLREPEESSAAVGLQRVLMLKRLESSPVTFLVSLLRLIALYGWRLDLLRRRFEGGAHAAALAAQMTALEADAEAWRATLWLCAGQQVTAREQVWTMLADAHIGARPGMIAPDVPAQLVLGEEQGDEGAQDEAALAEAAQDERLARLGALLCDDLAALLEIAPQLAHIVFGTFDAQAWPARFIQVHATRQWPRSAAWARRLVVDSKLNALARELVEALGRGERAVVFSQFTDTLDYAGSVLEACSTLDTQARAALAADAGLDADGLGALLAGWVVQHGQSEEDRDGALDRFAPFYRVGPAPRQGADALERAVWEQSWEQAMRRPITTLLASDILAEGVNLQDAALLIHFDLHWNPVRMIQRSGRIDRRLDPAIEGAQGFPALDELSARLGLPRPVYGWHGRAAQPPRILNMLLPDALEQELALRERLALKALSIDLTLGLEFGTGAEADWMSDYRWRGVAALGTERDRALEQIMILRAQIEFALRLNEVELGLADELSVWLREVGVRPGDPVLGAARLGLEAASMAPYARVISPLVHQGVERWPWVMYSPGLEAMASGEWLQVDGETWPPAAERLEEAAPALHSTHATPEALLPFIMLTVQDSELIEEVALDEAQIIKLYQGASALSPGRWASAAEREALQIEAAFIFQRRVKGAELYSTNRS